MVKNTRSSDWSSRRKKVLQRDGYKCRNCGTKRSEQKGITLEVHHVVPLKNGGSNRMDNLWTCCSECHNAIHYDRQAPTGNDPSETAEEINIKALIAAIYLTFILFALAYGMFSSLRFNILFIIHILCGIALLRRRNK